MTEAQPVEQTAHIRAVDRHPAPLQRNAQFVQGQFTVRSQTLANEVGMRAKFTPTDTMALPARRQRARFGLQLHKIVHKPRRHTKVTRRLPVAVAFLHKRNNAATQLDRMRLAHCGSPSNRNESPKLQTVNPFIRDAL